MSDICTIDEAGALILPADATSVSFTNGTDVAVDEADVAAQLLAQPSRRNISHVCLGYTSRLSCCILDVFPNVSVLSVRSAHFRDLSGLRAKISTFQLDTGKATRRSLEGISSHSTLAKLNLRVLKKDLKHISLCGNLEHLKLTSYPETDLNALIPCAPERITIVGGALSSQDGLSARTRIVFLNGCNHLTDLADFPSDELRIRHSENVRLQTLSNARNLRRLTLFDRRTIDSLDFLRHCQTLERLNIIRITVSTKFEAVDWSAVTASNLKTLVADSISDAVVEQLAKARSTLSVSNYNVSYLRGVLVPSAIFFEAVDTNTSLTSE